MNRQAIIYLKRPDSNQPVFKIGFSVKVNFIKTKDVVAMLETNDRTGMKKYIRDVLQKTYKRVPFRTDEIETDDATGIQFHFYQAAADYYAAKTLALSVVSKN